VRDNSVHETKKDVNIDSQGKANRTSNCTSSDMVLEYRDMLDFA
jgi:hypothetical protein